MQINAQRTVIEDLRGFRELEVVRKKSEVKEGEAAPLFTGELPGVITTLIILTLIMLLKSSPLGFSDCSFTISFLVSGQEIII